MHTRPTAAIRYAVAVAVVLLTFAARFYLERFLGDHVPLLPFTVSVIVAAWYGGLGPGLLATIVSAVLASYFFLDPRFSFYVSRPDELVGLVFFIVAGATASWLFEALHAARRRVEIERERSSRAEAALREADRHKDEFIAVLSHELRSPLAPLSNALHIVQLADRHEHHIDAALQVMERQVQQITRLVDDLLDLNRVRRGTLSLRRERVDLAAVLRRAHEMSQPAMDAGGHELTLSLPAEPLHVDGDPERLAQVFSNLLNNAAKYTAWGGRVRVSAEREGGEAVVRVRDNGAGIPKDMLSKIFDMFTQVDGSLARSRSGLGIGLSVVRQLVELHGGRVQARSEGPGHGSEFIVRVPAAPASDRRAAADSRRPIDLTASR